MYVLVLKKVLALRPVCFPLFAQQHLDDAAGIMAQWITRLPMEQKVPGSRTGKVDLFWQH